MTGLALAAPAAAATLTDRMIWTRHGAAIVDGPADQATLTKPLPLLVGDDGDLLIGDIGNHTIRRYDADRGRLDTIAGDGLRGFAGDGGPYQRARFAGPFALASDARGVIYVSDFDNFRIRAFNPTSRPVTVATVPIGPGGIATIAGNGEFTNVPESPPDDVPARETSMAFPRGVAVDAAGNVFYCDIDSNMVRVVWNSGPKAGRVETYAGKGWPADDSELAYPGDHGDGGPARDMTLAFPSAVTIGPDGDLYVAEWASNREFGFGTAVIWRIDRDTRTAHRVAGSGVAAFGGDGGPALDAGLRENVQSLVFDPRGNLYISDISAIRRVDAGTRIITTYAGRDEEFIPAFNAADANRPAVGAILTDAVGMGWHDGSLYYADQSAGVVRRIDRDGILRDVVRARGGIKQPFSAAIDSADRLFVTEWAHGRVRRVDPDGTLTTAVNLPDNAGADGAGPALLARSGASNGVTFDERGDMYFTDASASRVLHVAAEPGPGGRLIRPGSRIRELARLAAPFEAITDHLVAHGGKVWFGELIGNALIELDVRTGARRTLAGGDAFGGLSGLALDVEHRRIYVADPGRRRIAAVDLATGAASAVAELPYQFGFPNLHLALKDGLLFVSNDYGFPVATQVYVIDTAATTPAAAVFAGIPQGFVAGSSGDGGPASAAALEIPEGIALDSAGKLLIAERDSGRVRVVGTSDLVPSSFPNRVRARSGARVELAIQSNPSFDAGRLVPASVTIAGVATDGARLADVNSDGRRDLVVRVRERDLARAVAAGARDAAIAGRLYGGGSFADADWVTVDR